MPWNGPLQILTCARAFPRSPRRHWSSPARADGLNRPEAGEELARLSPRPCLSCMRIRVACSRRGAGPSRRRCRGLHPWPLTQGPRSGPSIQGVDEGSSGRAENDAATRAARCVPQRSVNLEMSSAAAGVLTAEAMVLDSSAPLVARSTDHAARRRRRAWPRAWLGPVANELASWRARSVGSPSTTSLTRPQESACSLPRTVGVKVIRSARC
jgi:hypothetical protein